MSTVQRLTPTASPLFDAEVGAAEAIVAALDDLGIEIVFGIPGGYTGVIFAALHAHPRIRVVQVREESLGSAAAEAYGRLRGKPAVIMGQGEWIVGNAGQGLLEALLGSSPVIVMTEMSDGGSLSHHGPYQGGTGDYGAWDAKGALGGVCKRVFVSMEPAQAVQHTQLAVKHALSGEPGPVAIIYHGNALRGTVKPDSKPRLYRAAGYIGRRSLAFDASAVEAAVEALRAAERPVILAGNGVRVGQACENLAHLARTLGAPVTTSASGKGVFPEIDPLAAGVVGTFGNPPANALLAMADLVLAVGTKLGPIDTADENPRLIDPTRQVLIQIDVEPLNVGWTYPVDHFLVGEASAVLDALAAALGNDNGQRIEAASERMAKARASYAEPEAPTGDGKLPMHPQRTVRLIEAAWPANGIVTSDAGENRLFMMHWYRTKNPGGYLQPAAGGGMGYAIPAALGAKLAYPDRPVLAVCGDGGFAMTIGGLMTAVQERLPITVVVFNNNALGWVLHGMGPKAVAASFDPFDYAAIARSVGCKGVRVENAEELRTALATAATTDIPYVIDVPTSLEVSFMDVVQDLADARWRKGE